VQVFFLYTVVLMHRLEKQIDGTIADLAPMFNPFLDCLALAITRVLCQESTSMGRRSHRKTLGFV
jgi:hypothetical protein